MGDFWAPFTWAATWLPSEFSHLLSGPQPGVAASWPGLGAGLQSKWVKAPAETALGDLTSPTEPQNRIEEGAAP